MNRRVLAVVPDLMFATRIAEAAKALPVRVEIVAADEVAGACRLAPRPDLVIVDLAAPGRPLETIRELKADPASSGIPILGCYPHVDQELRRAAETAGADRVVPRSAFVARLAEWLSGNP